MKRFFIVAALLGISSAVPALASERTPADHQPVTLSDQQLDSVSGGELLGLNLSSTLSTLTGTLQGTLNGVTSGLLGSGTGAVAGSNGLLGSGGNLLQPVNGIVNTATGLLNSLGL
jgi:hypothetical protein